MTQDLSAVTISASKPKGKPARILAGMGLRVLPMDEDEGNVDRYLLSKRVAVDRRTSASFLRGITDKTLFTGAIYLREHFPIPVLIVEGKVDYQYTAFDPQAVRGALSAMMLLYGVNVLWTPDVDETAHLVAMMARQEQLGIPEVSLIPKRKATDLADVQRRVVEMLPGCGMVMARELLQRLGSVRRIANAGEHEFRALRGIGAKKARDIYRVLNADYESVDTERDLEDAIEAAPDLLFEQRVTLLARQHVIFTEKKERHAVDLVFLSAEADELILVELKRQKLAREHYLQLRRYLDNAPKSKLLRPFLEGGTRVRGLLATVEESTYRPKDRDVSVHVVEEKRAVQVLKRLRARWLQGIADA